MRNLYLVSLTTVSYERETSYFEDMNGGYVGVEFVAKVNIPGNRLIPGLAGIVSSCPFNIGDTHDLNYQFFSGISKSFCTRTALICKSFMPPQLQMRNPIKVKKELFYSNQ